MDLASLIGVIDDFASYEEFTIYLRANSSRDDYEFTTPLILSLMKVGSYELDYYKKYKGHGAAFLIFDRSSSCSFKQCSNIYQHIFALLLYWLKNGIVNHMKSQEWWKFVKSILRFISKIHWKERKVRDILVKQMADSLFSLAVNEKFEVSQNAEAIDCLNEISSQSTKKFRMLTASEYEHHFRKLVGMLVQCGHLPYQMKIMELLMRWLVDRSQTTSREFAIKKWFPQYLLSHQALQIFKVRSFENFIQDAREFLNAQNSSTGIVFSVECNKFLIGNVLVKADGPSFWLDFNFLTNSVSILLESDTRRILKLNVEKNAITDFLVITDDNINKIYMYWHVSENIIEVETINLPLLIENDDGSENQTIKLCLSPKNNFNKINIALAKLFKNKYQSAFQTTDYERPQRPDSPIGRSSYATKRLGFHTSRSASSIRWNAISSRLCTYIRSPSSTSTTSLLRFRSEVAKCPVEFDRHTEHISKKPDLSIISETSEKVNQAVGWYNSNHHSINLKLTPSYDIYDESNSSLLDRPELIAESEVDYSCLVENLAEEALGDKNSRFLTVNDQTDKLQEFDCEDKNKPPEVSDVSTEDIANTPSVVIEKRKKTTHTHCSKYFIGPNENAVKVATNITNIDTNNNNENLTQKLIVLLTPTGVNDVEDLLDKGKRQPIISPSLARHINRSSSESSIKSLCYENSTFNDNDIKECLNYIINKICEDYLAYEPTESCLKKSSDNIENSTEVQTIPPITKTCYVRLTSFDNVTNKQPKRKQKPKNQKKGVMIDTNEDNSIDITVINEDTITSRKRPKRRKLYSASDDHLINIENDDLKENSLNDDDTPKKRRPSSYSDTTCYCNGNLITQKNTPRWNLRSIKKAISRRTTKYDDDNIIESDELNENPLNKTPILDNTSKNKRPSLHSDNNVKPGKNLQSVKKAISRRTTKYDDSDDNNIENNELNENPLNKTPILDNTSKKRRHSSFSNTANMLYHNNDNVKRIRQKNIPSKNLRSCQEASSPRRTSNNDSDYNFTNMEKNILKEIPINENSTPEKKRPSSYSDTACRTRHNNVKPIQQKNKPGKNLHSVKNISFKITKCDDSDDNLINIENDDTSKKRRSSSFSDTARYNNVKQIQQKNKKYIQTKRTKYDDIFDQLVATENIHNISKVNKIDAGDIAVYNFTDTSDDDFKPKPMKEKNTNIKKKNSTVVSSSSTLSTILTRSKKQTKKVFGPEKPKGKITRNRKNGKKINKQNTHLLREKNQNNFPIVNLVDEQSRSEPQVNHFMINAIINCDNTDNTNNGNEEALEPVRNEKIDMEFIPDTDEKKTDNSHRYSDNKNTEIELPPLVVEQLPNNKDNDSSPTCNRITEMIKSKLNNNEANDDLDIFKLHEEFALPEIYKPKNTVPLANSKVDYLDTTDKNSERDNDVREQFVDISSDSETIDTVGDEPITGHGDFSEEPPCIALLNQTEEPRDLLTENLTNSMTEIVKTLENEINLFSAPLNVRGKKVDEFKKKKSQESIESIFSQCSRLPIVVVPRLSPEIVERFSGKTSPKIKQNNKGTRTTTYNPQGDIISSSNNSSTTEMLDIFKENIANIGNFLYSKPLPGKLSPIRSLKETKMNLKSDNDSDFQIEHTVYKEPNRFKKIVKNNKKVNYSKNVINCDTDSISTKQSPISAEGSSTKTKFSVRASSDNWLKGCLINNTENSSENIMTLKEFMEQVMEKINTTLIHMHENTTRRTLKLLIDKNQHSIKIEETLNGTIEQLQQLNNSLVESRKYYNNCVRQLMKDDLHNQKLMITMLKEDIEAIIAYRTKQL